MKLKLKTVLFNEIAMQRALSRISHEIIEKNNGVDDVVLIGIKTRGVPMANLIKNKIKEISGKELLMGTLDITLYRDDLSELSQMPLVNNSNVSFDIKGKNVVLCDDVIFTGRTVRAAIDAIMKLGRPKTIQLAVLVDRGHRELPIRADYVGKNVPTSLEEVIAVKFNETDGEMSVSLNSKD
ncbi:bifunctional protein PyrR [Firmicutes bacterium CAG:449]|nr:bifunctional protein PyrR [Firmicutes bacterium CAG:449]